MSALYFLFLLFQQPFENEYVKVLDVVDKPHAKTAMHSHAVDRVMIYLTDGDQELAGADGTVLRQHWKARQVAWSAAGARHTSENVGGTPLRIIEIELKPVVATGKAFEISKRDPVVVDSGHYRVEFENERVRVFRGKYGPGEEGKMHEHLHNRVVVYLTDARMTVTAPDGKFVQQTMKAGESYWGVPVSHKDDSKGMHPMEMVVVELKVP
jgi:beta-alanine degradation protein BauB